MKKNIDIRIDLGDVALVLEQLLFLVKQEQERRKENGALDLFTNRQPIK